MSTSFKQLYRSRENRMIGGVCGGLGEYLGIDPTLVRIGFILGSLLGWIVALGLIYMVMLIIVPETPLEAQAPQATI
jgi:phage shock protein PspC (stress-responsive transcriptional regulator)